MSKLSICSPFSVVANASTTSLCSGESLILRGSGATSYTWDNGVSDGTSFVPTSTSVYNVIGTDANGCTGTGSVSVSVNPLPIISIDFISDIVEYGTTISLSVNQGYDYIWYPSDKVDCDTCNIVNTMITENTTYFVEASLNGCSILDSILISIKNVDLKIPYGFSPNNDGISDLWRISGLDSYPNNSVVVYNRWGNVVYKATPYKNDWQGDFKGQALPIGTYFFVLNLGTNNETMNGYVYINR